MFSLQALFLLMCKSNFNWRIIFKQKLILSFCTMFLVLWLSDNHCMSDELKFWLTIDWVYPVLVNFNTKISLRILKKKLVINHCTSNTTYAKSTIVFKMRFYTQSVFAQLYLLMILLLSRENLLRWCSKDFPERGQLLQKSVKW